jgi:predicted RNA-binding protein (virulence factor B family)
MLQVTELLGRVVPLTVRRFGPPGAFLSVDAKDPDPKAATILLPRAEVPKDAAEGASIEVFVYLDSEDRPIATTRTPGVTLGRVAFLSVTDVTSFGAFVDWGLLKELLVPRALQTRDMRVGERHPVGLFLDDTGRLAGTMRVSEMLSDGGDFELDAWVDGEAWRKDPELGVFVILEQRFLGLIPAGEPNTLQRGEAARFRVANFLADGKLELSLRGHAHQEVEGDAQVILAKLSAAQAPKVGDRSSPEEIRTLLGLSKKAFKRALGRLLKQRVVTIDPEGFVVVKGR